MSITQMPGPFRGDCDLQECEAYFVGELCQTLEEVKSIARAAGWFVGRYCTFCTKHA